jgi:hypothetical protein
MIDLRDGLGRIGGDLTPSTAEQADLDLALGRRAVRRRRTAQAVGGSLAAAIAVAAISLSVNGGSPDGIVAGPPAATASASQLRLVSYSGTQPEYYTVDWVPEGWFVQYSDRGGLIIAPDEAKNPRPGVNPSASPLYDPRDATGKISVSLSSRSGKKLPPGIKLTKIGDYQGMLLDNGGDYGFSVVLLLPANRSIDVHFWEGVGLSDQQMLQLAAGVHVSPKAKAAVG